MDNDHDNHDDHDDELQPQIWTYAVLAASIPLFWIGNWGVGLCFVLIGFMYMAVGNLTTKIPEKDQHAIRYNVWSAEDVVADLRRWQLHSQAVRKEREGNPQDKEQRDRYRSVTLVALAALAKKVGALERLKKNRLVQKSHPPQPSAPASTTTHSTPPPPPVAQSEEEDTGRDASTPIALACQEAVYASLRFFGEDDMVLAPSFALLALVAKNDAVRERQVQQADTFGFNVLVLWMTKAMSRAREYDDTKMEHRAAELQRKACLMLGALSDGDAGIARKIVEEGGLEAILDSMAWYRFHEEVANWALWAVFILCYEFPFNKVALVQHNGIQIVLNAMRDCPDSSDVARHATAILFDLLREHDVDENASDHPQLDVRDIRNGALAAGLRERMSHATNEFSGDANMDIRMMGQEILVGTAAE